MAKTEELAPEEATQTNRDAWLKKMRSKYPDIQNEDEFYKASMDGYDEEHEYAKRNRDENARMAEAINADPSLAALYSEIYERGKDGHPELALLNIGDLLKDVIEGNISTDEYIAEKNKRKKADDERKSNTAKQEAFVRQWCEKKGYDFEEWVGKLQEKIFNPIATFSLAEEQLEALDNMLNYDENVAAAEIRGRNANISAQRKNAQTRSDGLPSAKSSFGKVDAPQQNSISEMAERRARTRNL